MPLLAAIQKEITRQFGDHPLDNPDYGKIINEKHFERILGLIAKEKIICGGESDSSTLRIAPTVLTDVSWDDPGHGGRDLRTAPSGADIFLSG